MVITEYCILRTGEEPEVYGGPWPEQQCIDWLQGMEDDGVRVGVYYVASRTVTVTDWVASP